MPVPSKTRRGRVIAREIKTLQLACKEILTYNNVKESARLYNDSIGGKRGYAMKLKIGDYIITGIVLVSAFVIALSFTERRSDMLIAVVLQDGRIVQQINLSEIDQPLEFSLDDEYHNLVRVERGKIRFVETTCPDHTCVRTGWLTKPGQVAACLPNGTLIKIEGSIRDNNEVDIYLR